MMFNLYTNGVYIADPVTENLPPLSWNNVSSSAFRFSEVQQKLSYLHKLMEDFEEKHSKQILINNPDLINSLFHQVNGSYVS